MPESFKVVITGEPAPNVTAKDYMLEILRDPYIRDGHAIGQIIEYAGPAVEALSVDERATMTNMAAEVGAFTGIIAADEKSVEFMVSERGMDRARAESLVEGMRSDPDAEYVKVIEIDASTIRPMAALPNDPGNGVFIDELGDEPIRIDIAYAGSCTAGKKEDMDMYARVFAEADAQGLTIHADVKAYIQCGSTEVREYCREQGYLELFERMGAEFIEPGCGACIAAGPGGDDLAGRGLDLLAEPELPRPVGARKPVPRLTVLGRGGLRGRGLRDELGARPALRAGGGEEAGDGLAGHPTSPGRGSFLG